MTFDTFLFDFDGTLANTAPAIVTTFNQALVQAGYSPVSDISIRVLIGKPLELIFITLCPGCNAQNLVEIYKSKYLGNAREFATLFPGSLQLLQKLKESGKKLAIVSTKSEQMVLIHLKDFQILDLFDIVLGRDSVTAFKPNPEGILIAMQKLQAKPETTVMIGDTVDDLLAAQNAGIRGALVSWTNQNIDELKSRFEPIVIDKWDDFYTNYR